MSFWDIAQFVAPIAATAIGGPGAGIAVGGLMSGGGSLAKGEDWRTALLKGGLGAGAGALGAGMAGGLSSGAAQAGTKAAERGMAQMVAESVAGGVGGGLPQFSQAALSEATKGLGKQAAFTKFSDLFAKGLGDNPKETTAMLKTVSGGANALGQAASLFGPDEDPRFSSVQALMNGPGMSPMYQYGRSGGGRRTTILGTGRYY
jgi:hypothetical protein